MPIEKCCEDDLGAIVLLEKDVMPSPWTQEDFEYELFHNPFAHLFLFIKGRNSDNSSPSTEFKYNSNVCDSPTS